MKVRYRVEIDAPIRDVFSMLIRPDKQKEWFPQLISTEFPTRFHSELVGRKFYQKVQKRGQEEWYEGEIIAYREPRVLGVRFVNDKGTSTIFYKLSHCREDYTRLDFEKETYRSSYFKKMMIPVIKRHEVKRHATRQILKLKRLVESRRGNEPISSFW